MPSAQVLVGAKGCWLPLRECRPTYRRSKTVFAEIRTCPLPIGEDVAYLSKPDVAFLYREVFEKQSYLQHGVKISPGNTVLDVGANIGMFAAFAAQRVGVLGRVLAVEPIPLTCDVLRHNMGTMLREGDAPVTIINKGVGDGLRETVNFTFYPAAAGWSTMYPDATEVLDAMDVFLERSLPTLEGMDLSLTNRVASLAARIAPKWLVENVSRLSVNKMLAHNKHFCCPLTTVSAIIETEGLQCIDLLKIDVERAELDVLRGIADKDWRRIRQLVMEVHDYENTLSAVRELLDEKGSFAKFVVEQDSQLKGSTLYNLYALQD